MKKKLFGTFMVLALCLSLFPATALADEMKFTDVKPGDWFYDDVKTAVESGLVNGKSETIFGPDDNLTYAETVKLAACMHQKHTTGSVTLKPGNPWYQTYLDYCKTNNIISKEYPWSFNATRAEYMDIFSRALPDSALSEINTIADDSIPDVRSTHTNAAAIYKLYRAGIVVGSDAAHNCKPETNIKRSEVAAILTRMMDPDKRIEFTMSGTNEETKELKIITQPVDVTGKNGNTVNFSIKAQGEDLKYQWQYHNETNNTLHDLNDVTLPEFTLAGTKTDKLDITLKNIAVGKSFKYRCIVTDKNGKSVTSDEATLEVIANELKITKQPPKEMLCLAGKPLNINITVEAEGDGLEYQWQGLDGGWTDLKDYSNSGSSLTGTKTNKLTLKSNSVKNGISLYFKCIVKDKYGKSIESDVTTVKVVEKIIIDPKF